MPHPKTIVLDMENYYLLLCNGLIISLEIFKTPEDYIVFASSHIPENDDLAIRVRHQDKEAAVTLAINKFYPFTAD